MKLIRTVIIALCMLSIPYTVDLVVSYNDVQSVDEVFYLATTVCLIHTIVCVLLVESFVPNEVVAEKKEEDKTLNKKLLEKEFIKGMKRGMVDYNYLSELVSNSKDVDKALKLYAESKS